MTIKCNTILYPVTDIEKAKTTFSALFGFEPYVDLPYYVGYSVDGDEIGLLPGGHGQGMTGPEPFYDVEDIVASLAALTAAGAETVQEPTDVAAGLLVAKVRDIDGNIIGLKQPPASA